MALLLLLAQEQVEPVQELHEFFREANRVAYLYLDSYIPCVLASIGQIPFGICPIQ